VRGKIIIGRLFEVVLVRGQSMVIVTFFEGELLCVRK
jgi:hypothetical protein